VSFSNSLDGILCSSIHESLMTRFVRVIDFTWIWQDGTPSGIDTPEGIRLSFVPRYRTEPALCTVRR